MNNEIDNAVGVVTPQRVDPFVPKSATHEGPRKKYSKFWMISLIMLVFVIIGIFASFMFCEKWDVSSPTLSSSAITLV